MPHLFIESGRLEGNLEAFTQSLAGPRRNVAQGLIQEGCVWFQGQRFHSLPVGASLSRSDQRQKCSFPISNHDTHVYSLFLLPLVLHTSKNNPSLSSL